jgi:hypothetical protein
MPGSGDAAGAWGTGPFLLCGCQRVFRKPTRVARSDLEARAAALEGAGWARTRAAAREWRIATVGAGEGHSRSLAADMTRWSIRCPILEARAAIGAALGAPRRRAGHPSARRGRPQLLGSTDDSRARARERGYTSPVAQFILVVLVGRERECLGPGRGSEERRAHLGTGDHEFVERGEQVAILDGDRAIAFLGG